NVGIINIVLACAAGLHAGVLAPARRDRTEEDQHHQPQRSTGKSPARRRSAIEQIFRVVRGSQVVSVVSRLLAARMAAWRARNIVQAWIAHGSRRFRAVATLQGQIWLRRPRGQILPAQRGSAAPCRACGPCGFGQSPARPPANCEEDTEAPGYPRCPGRPARALRGGAAPSCQSPDSAVLDRRCKHIVPHRAPTPHGESRRSRGAAPARPALARSQLPAPARPALGRSQLPAPARPALGRSEIPAPARRALARSPSPAPARPVVARLPLPAPARRALASSQLPASARRTLARSQPPA